ncbi:MAG: DUF4389 domain-containing protein [Dehalococcoidia bacterium]
MATAEAAPYPVIFEAAYPERLSRWKTLLRIFLAIPVLIFWAAVSAANNGVMVGSWLAIIVRGRIPRWLFDFWVALYRWQYRALGYGLLLTEVYPPFEGDYPINFDVRYPDRLTRWKVLIWKFITAIPHFIIVGILGITVVFVTIVAWFYALIARRYPRGLFDYVAGVIRWSARVNAYFLSLTDEYPPFNLSATAGPAGGDTYLISCIIGFLLTGGIIAGGVTGILLMSKELEVRVDYAGLQAGRPADRVEIADVWVDLRSVSDPLTEGETLLEADSGNRLVVFEFSMMNDSWQGHRINESDFALRDEEGDKHKPELVVVAGHPAPEELEKDEWATVLVVFEVPLGVDPARLDFSPGFGFRKTVKYVFE